MKRNGWVLAAAVILGMLLTGVIGYLIWDAGRNRDRNAELIRMSQEEAEPEDNRGSAYGTKDGGTAGSGSDQGHKSSETEEEIWITGLKEEETYNSGEKVNAEDEPLRFVFAGDVLLSDHVLNAYSKAGDISGVADQGLRSVIDDGDVFMVNEEFPFSDRGSAAEDKQYTFRLPPEKVSVFKELGIDIVTLANNHALDFGADALLDTCRTLDQAGIYRVGAGADLDEAKKPVIMDVKGRKVGFLGASRVIPVGSWNATAAGPGMLTTYDPAVLLEEIKAARLICDYVIVYVHWGIERAEKPQDYQRTLGQQYIDAGADIVIGSHPHVLQGLEYYKGKPIVYSLGNFIFGSNIPRTALLTVEWDGENTSLLLTPAASAGGYTKEITDESGRMKFYEYMTSISFGAEVDKDGVVTE